MIRTILVAGIERPDNNVIKFCEDNFLDTYHYTDADIRKEIPVCDAVIIAYKGMSHKVGPKIVEFYKELGRPIIHHNGTGLSGIRDEFENLVYGKDNIKALRSSETPLWKKFSFLIGRFYRREEVIKYGEFREKFHKVCGQETKSTFSVYLNHFKNQGVYVMIKRGSWRFKGFTDRMYDDLIPSGLFLEKTELMNARVEVQKADAPMPVEPTNPTDLVLTPAMPPEAVVQRAVEIPQHHQDIGAALEILLETAQRLAQENLELKNAMLGIVQRQEEAEERLVKRIRKDVESTVNVHMRLFALAPKLRGKDAEQIDQFNRLLDFAEGWKPAPVPAQLNPTPN